QKTIALIGIRQQESLNRYNAINKKERMYKTYNWTTEISKNIYNAYPIHDWQVEDIWVANSKFNWSYNKIYDLFYHAGLTVHEMRVASPFNDAATESLKLY
ncbi:phosphoadenosine phosphosulfate reductase family protein, partial [Listeria monocytogenes]|nr:phosphoadenosine phosphosulfate reductase family protein [Listeria monocytogenes]